MTPSNNGCQQPMPEPLFVMQLALMPNGTVLITAPPQFQADTPEKIALAHLTASKVAQHFESMGFSQQLNVQAAPPGLRVPRNPKE